MKPLVKILLITLCFLHATQPHKLPNGWTPNLGQAFISFPTSTKSKDAQEHFINGIAGLHSFWNGYAEDEFLKSIEYDSTFVMGYWGAALCQFNPIWQFNQPQVARAYIAKMGIFANFDNITLFEKMMVDSVVDLFSLDSTWDVNNDLYISDLKNITLIFNDHVEAYLLYANALFSKTLPENRGFMKRDVIATKEIELSLEKVYSLAKNHPGKIYCCFYIERI